MNEIFKDIKGFEGYYQISNKGRIKSLHNSKSKFRKLHTNDKGYQRVSLTKKPSIRLMGIVHRLVAEAFLYNPLNKREVNHIDGNPSNNNVTNLEWVTSSENTVHSYQTGLQQRGENFYAAKLTEDEAIEIINAYKLGCFSQSTIAKAYGITKSSVKDLLAGRNWAHLGIQDEIRIRRDRIYQHNYTNPQKYKDRKND